MFPHNYDTYVMLPLLHMNTVLFDHAMTRDKYLVSRRVGGYYLAYNNSLGRFTCWRMLNGKQI